MIRNRAFAAVVAATSIAVCGIAYAQTPATPPATTQAPAPSTATSTNPGMEAQVENWTKKQWEAAKKEWAKDKAKWADCRKQSTQQKLKGRKSWSFLYKCMTN
jgi:hypothetical protein